jgi:hypothetical protein
MRRLREEALDQYRLDCILYAIIAPWSKKAKKPEVPSILRR